MIPFGDSSDSAKLAAETSSASHDPRLSSTMRNRMPRNRISSNPPLNRTMAPGASVEGAEEQAGEIVAHAKARADEQRVAQLRAENCERARSQLAMLQSGLDVSPVLTHRFPFDRFQEGFDVMLSGNCGKVILSWD